MLCTGVNGIYASSWLNETYSLRTAVIGICNDTISNTPKRTGGHMTHRVRRSNHVLIKTTGVTACKSTVLSFSGQTEHQDFNISTISQIFASLYVIHIGPSIGFTKTVNAKLLLIVINIIYIIGRQLKDMLIHS